MRADFLAYMIDTEDKKVLTRLRRANGQIAALATMIEAGEECEKVMIQFQAANAAVENAFAEFLTQSMKKCTAQNQGDMLAKVIHLLVKN